ncbi:putative bifunctional diguanylate cyclase/phosphodiesterase [Allochromatium palmeri]|uniref:EAL domain-containing protein n=1 Tax=Allochromatium palmeri TaxID=231048 RepID=A0A6N8E9E3_9GAMM|nr:GGDEF and EAL domain-containing protein [Allochromatium palmeri]MTW20755.1 EAL domain-containing protein [Allochromatium palmeri]
MDKERSWFAAESSSDASPGQRATLELVATAANAQTLLRLESEIEERTAELLAANSALRESEERFRRLFEDTRQPLSLIEDGRFIAVNRATVAMLRLERIEQLVGRSPGEVSPEYQPDGRRSDEKAPAMIRMAFEQGSHAFEWEHVRADGEHFPAIILLTAIRERGKDLMHVVWNDISEQRRALEQIEYLAFHDALTGLPNRIRGQDWLRQTLDSAAHHGDGLAVLYLDMDQFKYVNDTHGHGVGDQLLKGVAERLKAQQRESDRLCRLSGDEFMMLLTKIEPEHLVPRVSAVCERLLSNLAAPFDLEGGVQLVTSFSIGVALYPRDGADAETLMRLADTALYEAKKAGPHAYRFFEPRMNIALRHFVETRDALRLALERREFVLHYQPQFDLHDGRLIGVEALLRWQPAGEAHPRMPGVFIQVAEHSGLIVAIGRWVLREACRQAALWREAGWLDVSMAVNLSAVQFRQPGLEQDVIAALADSRLAPHHLELELTESILLQGIDSVLATVSRWKALGIRLSIDDFGTGYSSLAYLKRFKVDKLKIDRSFVSDIAHDEEDRAIVQAIIQMAHSLNLKTIAEGVESAAIEERLRTMGCEESQGYFYSRPLPAAELDALVAGAGSTSRVIELMP